MSGLLLANIAVTAALVGLIWTIQVVHYPLFAKVGQERWAEYHKSHTGRITMVVMPLMMAELVLAVVMAVFPPADELQARLMWWALGLTVVVWVSTFGIQVPLHGRLGSGLNEHLVRMLVLTNWIRTVGWSVKLGVLCWAAHAN